MSWHAIRDSREFGLLAMASGARPREKRLIRLNALIANGINWQGFLTLARRHRIEGLAFRDLTSPACEGIPQAVRNQMIKTCRDVAIDGLAGAARTADLARAFSDAGIACAVLKGAPQAIDIYGDVSRRSSIDIDLLVTPADRLDVHRLLYRLGYSCAVAAEDCTADRLNGYAVIMKDLTYRHRQYHHPVELHWRLHRNPWLLQTSPLDGDDWQSVPLAGVEVQVPSRRLLMLYLLSHGATTRWSRLKWLADIHHLTSKMTRYEAEALARTATDAGLAAIWAQTSGLLEAVYGGDARLPAARPVSAARTARLTAVALERLADPESGEEAERESRLGSFFRIKRYQVAVGQGVAHTAFELFTALFGDRDVDDLMLPRPFVWLYPLVAPVRFVARQLRRRALQAQPRRR